MLDADTHRADLELRLIGPSPTDSVIDLADCVATLATSASSANSQGSPGNGAKADVAGNSALGRRRPDGTYEIAAVQGLRRYGPGGVIEAGTVVYALVVNVEN